ncbi:4'-phosphopantetheinyl transferase family protein [Priestia koreensis]|uniref:4'-phosphopantetheinyl transferase family protein n=1 Tax=Priestia koreensis TaxID=284581 RepID=UPI001F58E81E|nr:4'-phosphopantetheinyl transferase superfamily protein [Priestia koreensis]MCM3005713.1 4'-phosphopantetheinyl transferase superfamily protein [Priestia koreensis]UNL87418.1 4'-phosphopantetheinyl transferase superfamily protein [Priestia koreensis]
MNIYAIKITTKLTEEEIIGALSKIPIERQHRVSRYIKKEDSIRSLYGSLLVQYIIEKELGITYFSYFYNEYGKPSINEVPNFYFNLSHSHEWVVCVTDTEEIGIDIEKINPIDFRIAERFFTSLEFSKIEESPLSEKIDCFYEYWTMKESYIKAKGRGFSIPLHSFYIKEKRGVYTTLDQHNHLYYFNQVKLDEAYKLATCSKKKIKKSKIECSNFRNVGIILNSEIQLLSLYSS